MRWFECEGPSGPGRPFAAVFRSFLVAAVVVVPSVVVADEARFSGQLDYDKLKSHAASGQAVRVTYSPGGTGAAAMQMAKIKRLVIDGPCHSACAWAFIQNANACFTRRAVFGFHGAADPGTGRPMPVATNYWLSHVRSSLRPRVEPVLHSLNLVYVSAAEMARHYPERSCEAANTTVAAGAPVAKAERKVVADAAPARAQRGKSKAKSPVDVSVWPKLTLPAADQLREALAAANVDEVATVQSAVDLTRELPLFESSAARLPTVLDVAVDRLAFLPIHLSDVDKIEAALKAAEAKISARSGGPSRAETTPESVSSGRLTFVAPAASVVDVNAVASGRTVH